MKFRVGTSGYQAPEVISETTVTQAIDMWSYGIILYELAVAYKPTGLNNNISHS
jgi:serine/threonine protein kinase